MVINSVFEEIATFKNKSLFCTLCECWYLVNWFSFCRST